jgi:dienelactone hydrolase
VEAETLAFGDRYQRLKVPFQGRTLFANLHSQSTPSAPLVVIVHGIDGCKEEHLATELALLDAGLAVLCLDGPGQAEALLLDGIVWNADFHRSISAALDQVAESRRADVSNAGVLGISIGGMWSLRAAADDDRIKAVFDLGGPINTRAFPKLPFLIKTRMCQVTGARDASSIAAVLSRNSIESEDVLSRIKASVRMLHGARDRVVSVPDKQWLLQRLRSHDGDRRASLRIIEDGDHCCTGHAATVRADAAAFFKDELLPPRQDQALGREAPCAPPPGR